MEKNASLLSIFQGRVFAKVMHSVPKIQNVMEIQGNVLEKDKKEIDATHHNLVLGIYIAPSPTRQKSVVVCLFVWGSLAATNLLACPLVAQNLLASVFAPQMMIVPMVFVSMDRVKNSLKLAIYVHLVLVVLQVRIVLLNQERKQGLVFLLV